MSAAAPEVTLAGLQLSRLPEALAEAGPGPAGGSAAAVAACMAAGLVRLVGNVSAEWDDGRGVAAQAAALGDRSLALASSRLDAFHGEVARARTPGEVADALSGTLQPRTTKCEYSTGEIIAIVLGLILGIIPGIILAILLC